MHTNTIRFTGRYMRVTCGCGMRTGRPALHVLLLLLLKREQGDTVEDPTGDRNCLLEKKYVIMRRLVGRIPQSPSNDIENENVDLLNIHKIYQCKTCTWSIMIFLITSVGFYFMLNEARS